MFLTLPAKGFLVTTSDFTKPAYDAAQAWRGKASLINGEKLLRYNELENTRITISRKGHVGSHFDVRLLLVTGREVKGVCHFSGLLCIPGGFLLAGLASGHHQNSKGGGRGPPRAVHYAGLLP
jgi:hypothetical protein